METIACVKEGRAVEINKLEDIYSDDCHKLGCPQFYICKKIREDKENGNDQNHN